jgi:hypothetical protein
MASKMPAESHRPSEKLATQSEGTISRRLNHHFQSVLPSRYRSSVRRCKDLIADHLSDLGGLGNVSAAERLLIRRAAVLTVELRDGAKVSVSSYKRCD